MGDDTRADRYQHLLDDLGVLVTLFMRCTPLCPHEIDHFESTVVSYASRYAELFPHKEPPPKMHG
eukprot:3794299-Pleurochrysis_carterae.AAC.1